MASVNFSGVYAIRNVSNDKVYVGSSAAITRRWACHNSLGVKRSPESIQKMLATRRARAAVHGG